MYLRAPLPIPDGRPLRVAIYARYSTEEQDASSIKDQFLKCRQLRELRSLSNVQFMEFSDAELSGELLRRPGIDQVKGIVDQRGCDVLICEESSRLFRAVAPTLDLVGLAFDREVRVLIINEDIDTADESWPDKLTDASSHHARSNRICGLRIKRKHDGLWEEGAAIGGLRPGYLRVPTTPPSLGKEAEGPFFDEIDPEWKDTILEAFERIANGNAPWMVAEWLTTEGLPKCSNSTTPEWNAKCVISLVRRLDYRGIQQFRTSVVKKEHSTGKHKLVKNKDLDKILVREMPHLRIVTDVLWYAANAAIDARIAVRKAPVSTHPLVGLPRDSRGPLSGIFYCGVCGSKMYQDGRGTGGYRCSGVRSNECWNKATADRNLTHAELGKAIFAAILGEREQMSVVIDAATAEMQVEQSFERQLAIARERLRKAESKMQTITTLVDRMSDEEDAIEAMTAKLRFADAEIRLSRLECERLEKLSQNNKELSITKETVLEQMQEAAASLLELKNGVNSAIRDLVPRIEAVPYRQLNSDKVVLRAVFTVNVAQLLPDALSRLLAGDAGAGSGDILSVKVTVDLFEPSNAPKHAIQAIALKRKNLTLQQIGDELKISKRSAHLAVQYGAAMEAAGVTDPFVELNESPDSASRWRDRGHRRNAG